MKYTKITSLLLCVALCVGGLSACGRKAATDVNIEPITSTPVQSSTPTVTKVGDIVIPTQEEALAEMGLDAVPQKVLCATYNTTIMAYNIGVDISGTVTTKRPLPEALKDVPSIGVVTGSSDFDFEKVIALSGDLVLSDISFKEKLQPTLAEQGIKSYFVDTSNFENLERTLALLGSAFGKRDETISLLENWQAEIKAMQEQVAGKESPSVLVIRKATNMATKNSYVGSLFEILGITCATNLMGFGDDVATYVPIDIEKIIETNPDYILIPGGDTLEGDIAFLSEVTASEAWASLDAVKNGKVIAVTDTYYQPIADMDCINALHELIDTVY